MQSGLHAFLVFALTNHRDLLVLCFHLMVENRRKRNAELQRAFAGSLKMHRHEASGEGSKGFALDLYAILIESGGIDGLV